MFFMAGAKCRQHTRRNNLQFKEQCYMLKDTLCCYLSRVAVLSLYEHLSAAVCKRPAGIYRLLPDVTLQTKKLIFQNFYIFDEHFNGKIPFSVNLLTNSQKKWNFVSTARRLL